MEHRDIIVIGGGPAGAAAAIRAARAGVTVTVFEKAGPGRDKVCGDGLTPRAVAALDELKIDLEDAHRIDGLRMIAGRNRRELLWPGSPAESTRVERRFPGSFPALAGFAGRAARATAPPPASKKFPPYGAVWPRRRLDAALIGAAAEAGAEIVYNTKAEPVLENGRVVGVEAGGHRFSSDLVVVATGAPGSVARLLGAERVADEPFGLAIRTYVESPRHDDRMLEASLAMKDANGTPIPGYGWMFPAGDGTVNLGVGALSTMKGFKKLNLNKLCDLYRDLVRDEWEVGDYLEKPRAWRLPMSAQKRHGPGWVAIGDAAGLINPMNGEGIDYGLEAGMLAADLFVSTPGTCEADYDRIIGERFDAFLRTGRRFSFLIGHPFILRNGLRVAMGTDALAKLTLQVMGNLVDAETPGMPGRVLRLADKSLGLADPLLRKTRAAR